MLCNLLTVTDLCKLHEQFGISFICEDGRVTKVEGVCNECSDGLEELE